MMGRHAHTTAVVSSAPVRMRKSATPSKVVNKSVNHEWSIRCVLGRVLSLTACVVLVIGVEIEC